MGQYSFEELIAYQNQLYKNSDLILSAMIAEKESQDYLAHSLYINQKYTLFRIAKKTPTKNGYFVTLWKRRNDGIIAPYDQNDSIDFVAITILDGDRMGQFIFPKEILLKSGIFSAKNQEGKRAFRVYAPWNTADSKQATKTQKWQAPFFINFADPVEKITQQLKWLYA